MEGYFRAASVAANDAPTALIVPPTIAATIAAAAAAAVAAVVVLRDCRHGCDACGR